MKESDVSLIKIAYRCHIRMLQSTNVPTGKKLPLFVNSFQNLRTAAVWPLIPMLMEFEKIKMLITVQYKSDICWAF